MCRLYRQPLLCSKQHPSPSPHPFSSGKETKPECVLNYKHVFVNKASLSIWPSHFYRSIAVMFRITASGSASWIVYNVLSHVWKAQPVSTVLGCSPALDEASGNYWLHSIEPQRRLPWMTTQWWGTTDSLCLFFCPLFVCLYQSDPFTPVSCIQSFPQCVQIQLKQIAFECISVQCLRNHLWVVFTCPLMLDFVHVKLKLLLNQKCIHVPLYQPIDMVRILVSHHKYRLET